MKYHLLSYSKHNCHAPRRTPNPSEACIYGTKIIYHSKPSPLETVYPPKSQPQPRTEMCNYTYTTLSHSTCHTSPPHSITYRTWNPCVSHQKSHQNSSFASCPDSQHVGLRLDGGDCVSGGDGGCPGCEGSVAVRKVCLGRLRVEVCGVS